MAHFLRRVCCGALAAGLVGQVSSLAFASASKPATEASSAYKQLASKLKVITNLGRVEALANWDQLVMMPDRAENHEERGDQLATLAAVIHERSTDPALGALIVAAEAEKLADERELACVREARKAYDRMTKMPAELAEKKAKLASSAYAAWANARTDSNFAAFEPILADCFATAAEVAKATRTDEVELYDVCLGEFEPGMTAARCEEIFAEVQATLKPLIARVLASPLQPSAAPLQGAFAVPVQLALNEEIVRELGFTHGRIDGTPRATKRKHTHKHACRL
jgi:carboxypeptidase Taq